MKAYLKNSLTSYLKLLSIRHINSVGAKHSLELSNTEAKNHTTNASPKKLFLVLLCTTGGLLIYSPNVAVSVHISQATTATRINRPILRVGSQGDAVSELQAALKLLGFYTGVVNGEFNENVANAVSKFQQAAGISPDGVVGPGTWQRLFPASPFSTTVATSPVVSDTTPAPSTPTTKRPAANTTRNRVPARTTNNQQPAKPATTNRTQTRTPTRQRTTTNRPAVNTPTKSGQLPILRVGMRGPDVTKLQQRLQQLGVFKGGVDGDFGAETEAAVKAAQQRYRLPADGVVGPATWEAIMRRRR